MTDTEFVLPENPLSTGQDDPLAHPPLETLIDRLVRVADRGREMRICPTLLAEPWRSRLLSRAHLLPVGMARQLQQWLA